MTEEQKFMGMLGLLKANVKTAREALRAKGVYGPVSVDRFDGIHLPYIENFVNLVVAEEPPGATEPSRVGRVEDVRVVRGVDPVGPVPDPGERLPALERRGRDRPHGDDRLQRAHDRGVLRPRSGLCR